MTKIILIALSFSALLGGHASATVTSIIPTYAVQKFIDSSPVSSQILVLKALQVSADTTSDACVYLYDSVTVNSTLANLKLTVCAKAGTTVQWPQAVAAMSASEGGIQSAASAFFGELVTFAAGHIISINSGRVDSTKVTGQVTASYQYQSLR